MFTNELRLSLFLCVSLLALAIVKSVFTNIKGKHSLNNTREKRSSYILPYIYLDWELLSHKGCRSHYN